MHGIAKDFDAIGCKSKVCVTNGRASDILAFLESHVEFICTDRDPRSGIERIGCDPGLFVARTDSDVIEVRGSGDSRQNDAHACIAWVGRLEVDVGACGLGVLNFGSELIHGEGTDRRVVIRVIERLIGQRFGERIIA